MIDKMSRFRDFSQNLDNRILVGSSAFIGFFVWFLPISALLFLNSILLTFLWVQGGFTRTNGRLAKRYALFILFWVGTKFLIDRFFRDTSLFDIFLTVALLTLRLLALAILSFIIIHNASPRKLGQTLNWYVKPILRDRAWKASLALSIMLSALPRISRMLSNLNGMLLLRSPKLPLYRRFLFIGLATLRITAQETESIAIAILSRDLYRPEPWEKD